MSGNQTFVFTNPEDIASVIIDQLGLAGKTEDDLSDLNLDINNAIGGKVKELSNEEIGKLITSDVASQCFQDYLAELLASRAINRDDVFKGKDGIEFVRGWGYFTVAMVLFSRGCMT